MTNQFTSAVIVLALLASGCKGGTDSPNRPTPTVQVGGIWSYTATVTGATGGDCLGPTLQAGIGRRSTGTLSITQTGASLTATSTDAGSGSTCGYTGTAGQASVQLNWTRCDVGILTRVQCSNGAFRDMEMLTNSITANISGSNATGTAAETWQVYASGTRTPVGLLTVNGSFSGTRR